MTPFEIATALVVCMQETYVGDTEAPAEICHRSGAEVPLNIGTTQNECCTGLGWVRIASIEPVVDALDTEGADYNRCADTQRRIVLELGVARCQPFGTANAGPTCAEWTALAQRIDLDASRMRQAVCCARAALLNPDAGDGSIVRTKAGSWQPLEASGGCAGGTMAVTVWVDCEECA